jgi:hypothetical protein
MPAPTPPFSGALAEDLINLILAFGGTRPSSLGLVELYQALEQAIAAFAGGGTGGAIGNLNPAAFGALGDGIYINDANLVAGNNILSTTTSTPFLPTTVGAYAVLQTPVAAVSAINGFSTGSFQPHQVSLSQIATSGTFGAVTATTTAPVLVLSSGTTGGYATGSVLYIQNTGSELDGGFFWNQIGAAIDSTHLQLQAQRTDAGATGSAASSFITDAAVTAADYGKAVSGTNIPSPAFVGSITLGPGAGFTLVNASGIGGIIGAPINPTGPVTGVTIGTTVTANTATMPNACQIAIQSVTVTTVPGTVSVDDVLMMTHAVYGSTAINIYGSAITGVAQSAMSTTIPSLWCTFGVGWTITGTNLTDTGNPGGSSLWAPFSTQITGYISPSSVTLQTPPSYSGTNQGVFVAHDDSAAFNSMLSTIPQGSTNTFVVSMKPGALYGVKSPINTNKQSTGFLAWFCNHSSFVSLGATNMVQQYMAGYWDQPRFDLQNLSQTGLRLSTGLVNQNSTNSNVSMTAGSNAVTLATPIAYTGGGVGLDVGSPVVIGGGENIPGAGRLRPNGLGAGLRSFVATITLDGPGTHVTALTLNDNALTSCATTRMAWGDPNTQPIGISYWGARHPRFTNMPAGDAGFAFYITSSDIGYPFLTQRVDLDSVETGFNYSAVQEVTQLGSITDLRLTGTWGHDNFGRAPFNAYAFDHAIIDAQVDAATTSSTSIITIDGQQLGGMGVVTGRISIRDPYGTGLKIINNSHYSDITYMVDARDSFSGVQAPTNSENLNLNTSGDPSAVHIVRGILPHGCAISGACEAHFMGAYLGPQRGSSSHIAPIRVTGFTGNANITAHGCTFELTGGTAGANTSTVLQLASTVTATVDIHGGRVLNNGVAIVESAGPPVTTKSIQASSAAKSIGGLCYQVGAANNGTNPVAVSGSVTGVQGLSNTVNRSASATVLPSEYAIVSASGTYTLPATPPAGILPVIFEVASGQTATLAQTDGSTITTSVLAGPGVWQALFDGINGGFGTWRVNIWASPSTGTVPIGSGMPWFLPGSFPTGFFEANGQPISRSIYSVLFGLWGTTYGAGDGVTTFNIPNIQNRYLVGFGDGGGGTAPSVGATGGSRSIVTANVPAHTHAINFNSGNDSPDHTHFMNGDVLFGVPPGAGGSGLAAGNTVNGITDPLTSGSIGGTPPPGTPIRHTHPVVGNTDTGTGSGTAYDPPFMGVIWLIRAA